MPYSLHSHSGQFCKHASGSLEEVVNVAVKHGFEIYGLTEHVPRYREQDLYPEELGISLDELSRQFQNFLDEAHRLQTCFSSEIALLVGLETEHISPVDLDGLSSLLDNNKDRIDYLVGSVHHVNGIPIDFDERTYERCLESMVVSDLATSDKAQDTLHSKRSTFFDMYFDAQYELIRRFYPEVVGHIDLCRLFTPALRIQDYPSAWAKLQRNVAFAVAYGALFEVNAAAFRKGWDTAYPGTDTLQLIQRLGGRLTISDDSHGPHAVGLNYPRMHTYLQEAGVSELWVLKRSATANIGGRDVCAVRVEGEWHRHVFWERTKVPDSQALAPSTGGSS